MPKPAVSGNNLKLYTTKQAAEILQLSEVTLKSYRAVGSGPRYVRLAHNAVRYPAGELASYIVSKLPDEVKGRLAA